MQVVSANLSDNSPKIRLQCGDHGGNFVLPYFGKNRPGRDYYISNLTIHMYIVSDLQTGLYLRILIR